MHRRNRKINWALLSMQPMTPNMTSEGVGTVVGLLITA